MTDPIPFVSNGTRKTKNQTRIAHISDLHFTSTTDVEKEDVWTALSEDLETSDADLLVVTGDIIDSSVRDNFRKEGVAKAFDTAKDYLISLCKKLDIDPQKRLAVVPGNHDFRVKGVFSAYSNFKRWEKVKQRFVQPHYDLFYKKFNDCFQPRFLPELRCCLFTFNSNTTTDLSLNLASGSITNNELLKFTTLCRKWSTEIENWPTYSKIALVHHHPMPIAGTELRGSVIDSDAYHLLKNAGLFMTEMVSQGVDLILHGHKHYPALSQARFPTHDKNSHTISIIAAGSASLKGLPHTSYNLVTIFDDGGVTLERRVREIASYSEGTPHALLPYDQTRKALFDRLADGMRARVVKYTRVDTIKIGSGDDEITEQYRGLRSISGEPQDSITDYFYSSSGFVSDPSFESNTHQVSWHPDPRKPGKGQIRFDPPLSDSPVDFNCKVTILNAMYFNQQDRLATQGGAAEDRERDETCYATITDACEQFVFKVKFPASFTPKQPKVHVLTPEKERDRREEEYASSRFTSFTDDKTAVLIIDHPLPRYVYKIVWGLPESEEDELKLSDRDRLWKDEIRKRLLNLDEVTMQSVLARLKTTVNTATADSQPVGAPDLEVVLHVLDPQREGLICVGATATAVARSRLLGKVIPVGIHAIGQACSRREHMKWVRGQNRGRDNAAFLDFDPDPPHSCIFSIPLSYPLNIGARVGVLTLATRDNTAPMIRLLAKDLGDVDEAAFRMLVNKAVAWYANDLMAAVNMVAISI